MVNRAVFDTIRPSSYLTTVMLQLHPAWHYEQFVAEAAFKMVGFVELSHSALSTGTFVAVISL